MYLLLAIFTLLTMASQGDMSPSQVTSSQEFEKELNFLKLKMENLETSESILKEKVGILERNESNLKEKVGILERNESILKENVGILERNESILKEKVGILETSESNLKEKVGILERSEREFKVKIENLERNEEETKKNEISMKSKVFELERKIDTMDTKWETGVDNKKEPAKNFNMINNRETGDKSAEEIDAFLTPRAGNNTEERLAYLEELSKMNLRRSCHELAQYGVNINNFYYVDPDGELLGAAPIRVWCDFSEGSAVTEVLHNSEEKIAVDHCHDPACYKRDIVYSAPDFQIQSLIELSLNCEQSIEYNCLMAPLQKDGVNFGYWLDKSGERMDYWDGANYGSHVCGCYFTDQGCLEEETTNSTCNCDAIVPELKSDVGTLRNASALPVSQLQFGGLSYEMQRASHQLGRLRCWGQANFDAGTSCTAIKKAGEFRSGFYNVKVSEETNSKLVFCKSSPGYNEDGDDEVFIESSEDHFQSVETTISGIETEITDVGSQVSILQVNVQDLMKRSDYCGYTSVWSKLGQVVTYEKLMVENNQNAPGSTLDIQTGEFEAGVSGLYQVDVSMWTYSNTATSNDMYLRRNGANIVESRLVSTHVTPGYGNNDFGGRTLMIQLDYGDRLSLYMAAGLRILDVIFCVKLAK